MKTTPVNTLAIYFFCSLILTMPGSIFAKATPPLCTIINTPRGDTIVQNFHRADQIKATPTEALIRVALSDMRKNKLSGVDLWVHNRQGQFWQGTTDDNGEVFFLLPYNRSYQINVGHSANYRKFDIPKVPNHFETVKVVYMTSQVHEVERNDTIFQRNKQGLSPSLSRVLVDVFIKDLQEQPLANEVIYFEAQQAGKVYQAYTDKEGTATLLLPKGDTYCIHSYAFRKITCKRFEKSRTSRTSRFEFTTISTAAFQKRADERKRLLAVRDSIRHAQRLRDSIQLSRQEYVNFYLQHAYKNIDLDIVEQKIKTCAKNDFAALSENEQYYLVAEEEIKSILYRNKERWPNKTIIANIDCSMYPYIDELLVWNYSNPSEQRNNQYYLFNGFNYTGEEKTDHSRRGIFKVHENDVKGFFSTIDQIVNFSCRGSRLENVVEALLLGAQKATPEDDLIFIADNYSDVSDLHLLHQLDKPVHVLLTASSQGINENYLEIAHRTGGTIHTLQQDITAEVLQALEDGQQLDIDKHSYTFYRGKFIKVTP